MRASGLPEAFRRRRPVARTGRGSARDAALAEGAARSDWNCCARGGVRFHPRPSGRWRLAGWSGPVGEGARSRDRMVGVCSSGAPAMERSWRAKRVQKLERAERSRTDPVQTPFPEALADLLGLVDDVLLVEDRMLVTAMRQAHQDSASCSNPLAPAALRRCWPTARGSRDSGLVRS